MLLRVAESLLIFHFCFQFIFSNLPFDLCNLNKNSALIFHAYLSLCLTPSETKKK